MAGVQTVNTFSTPPDWQAEQADIDRRRQLAQLLQQQSMQPMEQQTAGGYVLPTNPLSGLAKMLQGYAGMKGQEKATQDTRDLYQKQRQLSAGEAQDFMKALSGTPASTYDATEFGGDAGMNPAVAPDMNKAMSLAMSSQNPMVMGAGGQLLTQELQKRRMADALSQAGMIPGGQTTPTQALGQGGQGPTPQAAAQIGQPTGQVPPGVSPQAWNLAIAQGDLPAITKMVQEGYKESNQPVVNRGFGLGRMVNGQYVPDQASTDQALGMERGKAGITQPFESPVTLKTTSGQEVQLSRPEWAEYQKTQRLPARIIGSTPASVPPQDAGAFGVVASASKLGLPGTAQGGLGIPGVSQSQTDQIQQEQQRKTAAGVGEGLGKRYNEIQDEGFSANSKINRIGRLGNLFETLDTGKLSPTGYEIAAYAKAAGFPVGDSLDNAQAVNAVAKSMALELRNPSGGAGMPGALSDRDREFLEKMVASLDKTPGANRLILDGMTKMAQRDKEVAQLARDYKKSNSGQFDDGFYDKLREFSETHPLFQESAGPAPMPQRRAADRAGLPDASAVDAERRRRGLIK